MSKRLGQDIWRSTRELVWKRDNGTCQHCYKPIALNQFHCDHILPKSERGGYDLKNLRTLCRRCHVLRANNKHRGMMAKALFDGVIPANWRELVWE